ncbi:MAG TPA: NADPH-dependent FMN reductase [Myxococcaceae bacterium]|nr:NADPH-dependent FMN reductase [Myxococcaceae bacterium]
MRVLAISGSLRALSSNRALLHAAAALVPAGMEWETYDGLAGLPHFNPDDDEDGRPVPLAVAELRTRVIAADGWVISSPEYAHGVPGSLKNALDWLVSCPELPGKPVLLLNASAAGGDFAQAALKETLRTMSLQVLAESLTAPFLVRKLREGSVLEPDPAKSLRHALEALAAAIRRLGISK